MSICNECRYRIDDKIHCLKFNYENWHLWVKHMEEIKMNGFSECELFKNKSHLTDGDADATHGIPKR